MNIGEANAVNDVIAALTFPELAKREQTAQALAFLSERAARTLQAGTPLTVEQAERLLPVAVELVP